MSGEVRRPLPKGVSQEQARQAVAAVAEAWGADWEPGTDRLNLAATAGLRIGWVRGRIVFEGPEGHAEGDSLELRFEREEEHFVIQRSAAFFLALAALGGLYVMIWPFLASGNPGALQLVPLAALLGLGGWFLVVSRLRNAGPEEFLKAVAEHAGEKLR